MQNGLEETCHTGNLHEIVNQFFSLDSDHAYEVPLRLSYLSNSMRRNK